MNEVENKIFFKAKRIRLNVFECKGMKLAVADKEDAKED